MKVLVMYYSQSGNTEKLAKAISDAAAKNNEVVLKRLEEVTPVELAGFDFIFLGSPLHAGSLAAPVKECLDAIQGGSGQKLAGFITHFAPAYPEQDMDGFTEPIRAVCNEKGIEYKGCFDCQGYLADALHEAVQKKMNLTDDQWADMVKQMTGRPNDEDVANVKQFAREVLNV